MKNFYLTQKLSQRDKGLGQGKTNDMRVLENIYLSLMFLDNDRNWKPKFVENIKTFPLVSLDSLQKYHYNYF